MSVGISDVVQAKPMSPSNRLYGKMCRINGPSTYAVDRDRITFSESNLKVNGDLPLSFLLRLGLDRDLRL